MYCYHFIVFYEIIVIQQTTSCVIISLTTCNFLNVFIYFYMIFDWLIKNVFSINHNNIVFKSILSAMVKQKVYLLPQNLGQLRNLNIGLEHLVVLFLNDIYSSQLCVWILILIIAIVFHYLELIKLQLKHKFSYQLLQMLYFGTTQFADQVIMRLISQLINGFLRVLQKLVIYFNGTITWTAFVPTSLVEHIIFCLNLKKHYYQENQHECQHQSKLVHLYIIAINFLIICFCIVYFAYAIRKWSTIFKYYLYIFIPSICC